jgi:hypothetical protein
MDDHYPKEFIDLLNSIEAKRPKTVIQHILQHGRITSQELKDVYGYNHPPRAIRDVREQGIPIEMFRITGTDRRSIAAYKFGDPQQARKSTSKAAGRTALSKAVKQALIDKYGSQCFIYHEKMDERLLQVDHRIPYEIGGEQNGNNIDTYMLLCPSANRAKSWTCEHCVNWEKQDIHCCIQCFWANPENYNHVAGNPQKIVTIVFTGDEIEDYKKLIKISGAEAAQDTIKKLIHDYIK